MTIQRVTTPKSDRNLWIPRDLDVLFRFACLFYFSLQRNQPISTEYDLNS